MTMGPRMTAEQTALLRRQLQRELADGGTTVVATAERPSQMGEPPDALFAAEPAQATAWTDADDAPPAARHGRCRALIADDSSFVRYGLRKLLIDHGYEVIEAADGERAVECYATARPEAVLLDITMPKMDGLEALRRIRRLDPTARVAMVTGMGQQAIVIEAVKSGACDFIVKPFERDRVLAAVQKLVAS